MIMSTGMATVAEIEDAVKAATEGGCTDLTLLHCVSAYPAPVEQTNLATMVAHIAARRDEVWMARAGDIAAHAMTVLPG